MHPTRIHRTRLAATAALLFIMSNALAMAGVLDGTSKTINSTSPVELWTLRNGAVLTATGATTSGINSTDSIVNLYSVTNNGTLTLRNGSAATISDTLLNAAGGTGLTFGNAAGAAGDGLRSNATLTNSRVNGATGIGARVEYGGVLNLIDSAIFSIRLGSATGLLLANGETSVTAGSTITGMRNGVRITNINLGSVDYGRTLIVDGSTITSNTGAAISVVGSALLPDARADITIANGSVLHSGNGNLLEVDRFSSAKFTNDASALEGNIVVEEGGSANVSLRNMASIKGVLSNVAALQIASGSSLILTGDSSVDSLTLDTGIVEISAADSTVYNTLTLGSLSGRGTFIYNTNLGVPEGDKLVITGTAEGTHQLYARSTGVSPTEENALTLVETNGGHATFTLRNNVVELGVYKYYLNRSGTNWVLAGKKNIDPVDPVVPNDPTCTQGVDCPVDPVNPVNPDSPVGPVAPQPQPTDLSESAMSAIALHAAAANVRYSETAALRQRLGNIRMGKRENGVWGRTYGRGIKGNGANDVAFDQTIWGLQAGAETEVILSGVPIVLGGFGGYSNSKVKLDGGSEGDIDSTYAGIYGAWLGEGGLYVDGQFQINHLSTDASVVMVDGVGASGGYHAMAFGGEAEAGRAYDLGNDWFATPFARLSAVRIGSFDYQLNNGLVVDGDADRSVQGRIGATFGIHRKLENGGVFQPYIRLAVAQEFIDRNKLMINSIDFNNAFNGTRGEVGTGFAYQLADTLQLHADVDFSAGKSLHRNWGGNFGLSYNF
ncbi:autotransporter outer membrane beta-barrel domain-containing protein [Brucella pituitosa]|uniref:autotransporter outer membrane beta-barrel domain-containing protein n=1 Tax=Brucella pituitosa TaxID=571256 RepID=UPI00137479E6|nr:autotransporter outer membrane beta-barrel domain-containing protein [Brucella pituitosa]